MQDKKTQDYIKSVLNNIPSDWLRLTTHRLDIFNEKLAKTEFIGGFEDLFQQNNASQSALNSLPTAFDYIRLGHPLSCVLEWFIAKSNLLSADSVITFSSKTIPILAILRKNLLDNRRTQILYTGNLPEGFDADSLRKIYGYEFELKKVISVDEVTDFCGSTIFISQEGEVNYYELPSKVDFIVHICQGLGSILIVNSGVDASFIPAIQHVRRRETIAMTPANCVVVLEALNSGSPIKALSSDRVSNKTMVLSTIQEITDGGTTALVGSSGLSIQYAIMMGLVHDANENYPGKAIKFVVPPNCYGGTNDQARRVAACIDNVEIVDLPVDGDNDMVQSVEQVLTKIADQDAIPYIIAEIPTNPRVEVPELIQLNEALSKVRKTSSGATAVDPVFILDQTFCPNVHFLGEGAILSNVRTISYASGSKFPSGGLCTAGYCVGNKQTQSLMEKIDLHLQLCDNEATDLQLEILAKQMPSMLDRIHKAYLNTREFVNFIQSNLPGAKINFVSEELASQGFTPSVFSLDLPTKGNTAEEKETYKRALNHKLINLMITRIPKESKYCVSYGQLKGCYWTIPATSTQGTTKEGDKDYIARVAVSPDLDLDLHKEVFLEFVGGV